MPLSETKAAKLLQAMRDADCTQAQKEAAEALEDASAHAPNVPALMNAGATAVLLAALEEWQGVDVRERCAHIIYYLTFVIDPSPAQQFVDAGILAPLVKLLNARNDCNDNLTDWVPYAVYILATPQCMQKILDEPGLREALEGAKDRESPAQSLIARFHRRSKA